MGIFSRSSGTNQQPAAETDEQALERYRYMLATAPPEDIERAHEEAFARLTPDQRRQALKALAEYVPAGEIRGDDPRRSPARRPAPRFASRERSSGPGVATPASGSAASS